MQAQPPYLGVGGWTESVPCGWHSGQAVAVGCAFCCCSLWRDSRLHCGHFWAFFHVETAALLRVRSSERKTCRSRCSGCSVLTLNQQIRCLASQTLPMLAFAMINAEYDETPYPHPFRWDQQDQNTTWMAKFSFSPRQSRSTLSSMAASNHLWLFILNLNWLIKIRNSFA